MTAPRTATLRLYNAARNLEAREVPATIVGDLAIHRAAAINESGETMFSTDWNVSHICGDSIRSLMPAKRTLPALRQWARDLQAHDLTAPWFRTVAAHGLDSAAKYKRGVHDAAVLLADNN